MGERARCVITEQNGSKKNMMNSGLLILRLVLGLTFVGHGGQKLFGWFGGQGLKGTNMMMERLSLRPTWLWGLLAGLSEFGGGALLALGLLNPLGSLGIIAAMLVAITRVMASISMHGFAAPD